MNKRNKKIIAITLTLILLMLSISLFFGIKTANAKTIEEYESQIEINNNQIIALEEIKNQLHTTAELLRNNEYINNGFDILLSQKWHECNVYQNSKHN